MPETCSCGEPLVKLQNTKALLNCDVDELSNALVFCNFRNDSPKNTFGASEIPYAGQISVGVFCRKYVRPTGLADELQ